MDWKTIVATALSSGSILTLASYLLKKGFEKAVDTKFEKFKEENKASIQEYYRRQARIFDAQYDTATTIISLIYRQRNLAREILEELQKGQIDKPNAIKLHSRFSSYSETLSDIMYDDRLNFNEDFFRLVHKYKRFSQQILAIHSNLETNKFYKKGDKNELNKLVENLSKSFNIIDNLYQEIVDYIQERFNI